MFSMKDTEQYITEYCAAAGGKPPVTAAMELMESGKLRTHGPEHHYMTAAVLCAAWYSLRGEDARVHLEKLAERCRRIPPAVCGYYGVCGVSMAAGAFLSEALEVNYLSGESWRILNLFTARVQQAVALAGESGPRCCKRSSFAVLQAAVDALRELLGVELPAAQPVKCRFCGKNESCLKNGCSFYPGRGESV